MRALCSPLPLLVRRRLSRMRSSPLSPVLRAGGLGTPLEGPADCVYLDYNATTPIFPEVAEAMLPFLSHFGNPSSGHAFARPCSEALTLARARVAALVNASPDEILFCSCGTEADAWAIQSAVESARAEALDTLPHVVTSSIEHPAVLLHLEAAAAAGLLSFTAVGCGEDGVVQVESVVSALTPATCLVSLMHSNNETGALQPVGAVVAAVAASRVPSCRVLVHTDAAQSVGKVSADVASLGVDYCTVVAHKFGGPKGVAALFVKRSAPVTRLLRGGGQERGLRAGTENVLCVVGMGAAAALAIDEAAARFDHCEALRDAMQATLVSRLGGEERVRVHGPADSRLRLPNTLSVGFDGVSSSHALVAALAPRVALSAGAACHAAPAAPRCCGGGADAAAPHGDSHDDGAGVSSVLKAMRVPRRFAVSTLRLSVGRHTTADEVAAAVDAIVREVTAQRGGAHET